MIPLTVVVGDPINNNEVRIPLTGCRMRSNQQEGVTISLTGCRWKSNSQGGYDPIRQLSLEIQLTTRRLIRIALTGCRSRSK
jgi:hypothetical protein